MFEQIENAIKFTNQESPNRWSLQLTGVSYVSTFINVLLYRNTSTVFQTVTAVIFSDVFKSLNHIIKEIKTLLEVREISMNKYRRWNSEKQV